MSHKGTILVVDDDSAIAEMLVEVLGEEGYAVYAVQDGASARSAAAAYQPDLVLLDLHIPGSSAADRIANLRRSGATCAPIVLITASPREAEALLGDGVPACLAKPFDFDELIACVDRYIRRDGAGRGAALAGGEGATRMASARLHIHTAGASASGRLHQPNSYLQERWWRPGRRLHWRASMRARPPFRREHCRRRRLFARPEQPAGSAQLPTSPGQIQRQTTQLLLNIALQCERARSICITADELCERSAQLVIRSRQLREKSVRVLDGKLHQA